jgi:hypothetical protein
MDQSEGENRTREARWEEEGEEGEEERRKHIAWLNASHTDGSVIEIPGMTSILHHA